ncbi:MoaA/NifB/PqqE/SkfB family radical SAM enzyme [Micromonospora sp. Llam0]|uniref:radical SAM protein n=1 Tax=Micromonospora sp. Llam0 TaxID=2485143 RepID=UPI000F466513|nr:radical SAM protein [Micromonospora sp. Llam0]ROO51620.1 MoaA/NifB/PqqE/SkfB family radical SAM enzyme [Micromonospora sp. Llam0]
MTGVSLLWALRSPCNLGCRYCYFGTVEEHRAGLPDGPGMLSHLSRTDLDLTDIVAFVDTLPGSRVDRIFIAGGEPLIWPPVLDVVAAIKAAGVQVVLCTNGIPLNRPQLVERILAIGVDAVSVSLDSADASYNDHWRPARNGQHGHVDVSHGIRALLGARGTGSTPRVGIYTVITRRNLDAVTEMAVLAARLGCDYFVPQPIALQRGHPLHQTLSLTPADAPALERVLDRLYAEQPLPLPAPTYPGQVVATVAAAVPGMVRNCFGGTNLFFIEPDGSVWDCPSSLKIAASAHRPRRDIRGNSAKALFGPATTCADCALFSVDCVNMWPLMDFDSFLWAAGSSS